MKIIPDITRIDSVKRAWFNKTEKLVHKIGFEYGIYCFRSDQYNTLEVMATKNTIAWVKHYISNGYLKYDPVAKRAFKKEQFILSSIQESNKIVKKIMDERRSYGMRFGITIPLLSKFGAFVSGISLSTKNSQVYVDEIISNPVFTQKVYDIHIKTTSHALSFKTGLPFNICYAIVLSQYTHRINFIAEKTGFSADELQKLFGQLYLYCRDVDFFCLDIEDYAIDQIKDLQLFLKEKNSPIYTFSKRQLECIELIKKGLTAKQAARVLKISHRTYEEYTRHIRQKLNCANQKELLGKLIKFLSEDKYE